MSAGEWFLLGLLGMFGAAWVAIAIVSINEPSEADDAEQRRAVAEPWTEDDLRKRGLL